MQTLFRRGLRGEPQKETEIGFMPGSWTATPLAQICALSTGTTPATKRADFYIGTTPFIKTAEIVNNRISQGSTFVSDEAISEYNLKIYRPGTLFMAMYGQGKTRGQVSLLEIAATTSQNAAAIEPNERLSSAFLWHYLLSQYDYLRGIGSLGHLSHLNLGYMRELLIPLPPTTEEQDEIVAILDAIDRKIGLHKHQRTVLDALFKSLLHKLMTGEIRVGDLDLSALDLPKVAEAAA
jgi:type I restriction enzyme S subunit